MQYRLFEPVIIYYVLAAFDLYNIVGDLYACFLRLGITVVVFVSDMITIQCCVNCCLLVSHVSHFVFLHSHQVQLLSLFINQIFIVATWYAGEDVSFTIVLWVMLSAKLTNFGSRYLVDGSRYLVEGLSEPDEIWQIDTDTGDIAIHHRPHW